MNVYLPCCLNSVKEIFFFFFLTICARNAYLGSKLEYDILCQKNEQFLPSFKQLQKKKNWWLVMVGENCQRLKCGILSDLQKIKCKAEGLRIASNQERWRPKWTAVFRTRAWKRHSRNKLAFEHLAASAVVPIRFSLGKETLIDRLTAFPLKLLVFCSSELDPMDRRLGNGSIRAHLVSLWSPK